ncbi:hypothetical protein N7489_010747 [Penicillium chrysogenum]|uniref:uncharacterized protein n=1 Tax=Penicillium chrysogenum TaxID=5076 RepID=UPI0024DF1B7A|nr:uncharacterized protein N7489_010747 [Penicillium chrysogenum]KAJ5230039.1 hypothetical protein N7489_010747 [Penicillium chrysogenum]KAJ6140989.1 hypothetical protein N7497_011882 [Penicillium chrysogenum]
MAGPLALPLTSGGRVYARDNTYEISALCGVLHVVLYLARVALLLLLPLFAAKFTSTSSEDTVTLFTAAKNVTLAAGEY